MVNRYIKAYDQIISYARMKYFMRRAILERTEAKQFNPTLNNLDMVAKLRNVDLTINKQKILVDIDLKVMKGDFIGVYGR